MAAVSEAYAAEAAAAVQHKTLTLHTVHPTQFMDVTRLIEEPCSRQVFTRGS